jgi:hypothetical protein
VGSFGGQQQGIELIKTNVEQLQILGSPVGDLVVCLEVSPCSPEASDLEAVHSLDLYDGAILLSILLQRTESLSVCLNSQRWSRLLG